MKTRDMLASHPKPVNHDTPLAACIDACFQCAQCCTSCADACLAEDDPAAMAHCIRTDLDCADICSALGRILSRQTMPNAHVIRAMVEACRISCQTCGEECRSHGDKHEHCRICGECCAECEKACENLLASLK